MNRITPAHGRTRPAPACGHRPRLFMAVAETSGVTGVAGANGKDKMVTCLDLFCGAGGAGEGYRRAGFEVTGVDIKPQPHNPHRFILGDALEFLREHGREFDFIHASPPCQGYSTLAAMHPGKTWPKLIDQVRSMVKETGKSYVIENVETAPLRRESDLFGNHGVMLCGSMFGLGVARGFLRRHRIFETSFAVPQPACKHVGKAVGVYGHGGHTGKRRMLYREEAAKATGIDWMNRDEMCQAIPPAYTEYLGRQVLAQLDRGSGGKIK
jgi:DNA (cytosine-5)-methyltransferase 1